MINALSPSVEPREVILDVFGFSRGAAAARYFVNCFRQGFIRYWVNYVLPRYAYLPEGRNVGFRFDGIFDTVAAIGRGTNDRHGDVNVHLSAAQADQIYHLTAQQEYRENFRLNHNIPGGGATDALLGAHSDVGGGYRDQGDETRVAPSETHVFFDLPSAETAHRAHRTAAANARNSAQSFWVEDGWIRPNETGGGLDNAPTPIPMVRVASRGGVVHTRYTYRTSAVLRRPWVSVGLSRIPLRIMYDQAVAAGVPFNAFPTGGEYAVPPRLAALWGPTMRADALPSAENQRTILREFGHPLFEVVHPFIFRQMRDHHLPDRAYWITGFKFRPVVELPSEQNEQVFFAHGSEPHQPRHFTRDKLCQRRCCLLSCAFGKCCHQKRCHIVDIHCQSLRLEPCDVVLRAGAQRRWQASDQAKGRRRCTDLEQLRNVRVLEREMPIPSLRRAEMSDTKKYVDQWLRDARAMAQQAEGAALTARPCRNICTEPKAKR